MKKLALGCGGILVLLIVLPIVSIVLATRDIKSASKTMFQQFSVGAPVIPFSLAQSGRAYLTFSHVGNDRGECLRAFTRDGRVTLSYDGREEIVRMDEFQQRLVSLREHVVRCNELSVHYFSSIPIPARATFVVHYDPSGNVSKLEAPYIWD